MQEFLPLLVVIFVGLIWTILFYLVMRAIALGIKSKTWPQANGHVVNSVITGVKPSETGMLVRTYRVIIQYKYTVNGTTYLSDLISYNDLVYQVVNKGLRSKKGAIYLASKYPSGSEIMVYYDPQNPNRAILEPGARDFNTILIIITLGVMGILLISGLLALL